MDKNRKIFNFQLAYELFISQFPKLVSAVVLLTIGMTTTVMLIQTPEYESKTKLTLHVSHPYLADWQVERELQAAIDNQDNFEMWRANHPESMLDFQQIINYKNVDGQDFTSNASDKIYQLIRWELKIKSNDTQLIANFISYLRFIEALQTENYKRATLARIEFLRSQSSITPASLQSTGVAISKAKEYFSALNRHQGFLGIGPSSLPKKTTPTIYHSLALSILFSLSLSFIYFFLRSSHIYLRKSLEK